MAKLFSIKNIAIFLGILSLIGLFSIWKNSLSRLSSAQELIYVVNIQKIWEDLPATKQIQEDLQKILEIYHQQLTKTEAELKAEHQALLSAEKSPMSVTESHALEKRKSAFEAKVEATQKNVETKQQSINKRHTLAMEKLRAIIHEKVKEVANEQGIEVILSAQQVIYSNHNRDLTDKVYEKVKAATNNFHMEPENHD